MMRAAYACFRDGSPPEAILAAAEPARGSHDTFYAQLVSVCPPLGCLGFVRQHLFSVAMPRPTDTRALPAPALFQVAAGVSALRARGGSVACTQTERPGLPAMAAAPTARHAGAPVRWPLP